MMAIKYNKSYFRELEIGLNADEREGICRIEIHTLGESVIYKQNRHFPTLAIHPNQTPSFNIKLFQDRIESEILTFHSAVFEIAALIRNYFTQFRIDRESRRTPVSFIVSQGELLLIGA
jgi:hypothetical protein